MGFQHKAGVPVAALARKRFATLDEKGANADLQALQQNRLARVEQIARDFFRSPSEFSRRLLRHLDITKTDKLDVPLDVPLPRLRGAAYVEKALTDIYRGPNAFLDKLWLVFGAAGTAYLAIPSDSQIVGDKPELVPALFVATIAANLSKERFVKSDMQRRARKALNRIQTGLGQGCISTDSAIDGLTEIDQQLRSTGARHLPYFEPIVGTAKTIMRKIVDEISAKRMKLTIGQMQYSEIGRVLTATEEKSLQELWQDKRRAFLKAIRLLGSDTAA